MSEVDKAIKRIRSLILDFSPTTGEETRITKYLSDRQIEWVAKEVAAALRTPSPLPIQGEVEHPVFAFLLGEGQLEGRGFGDEPPINEWGRKVSYWWRKHLREAISAARPSPEVSSEALVQARGTEVLADRCRELEEENQKLRLEMLDQQVKHKGLFSARERIARLEEALRYIVEHDWAANTRQAGKWINEFVEVARQALGVQPLKESEA